MSSWPGFTQLQHLSLAGCKAFPAGWDEMGRVDNNGMALARALVRMSVSTASLQHLELQGLQLDPTAWLQGAHSLLSLNLAGKTLFWNSYCSQLISGMLAPQSVPSMGKFFNTARQYSQVPSFMVHVHCIGSCSSALQNCNA